MLDTKNQKKNYTFALALIVILAFILRCYRANVADLYADEAFSYFISLTGIKNILNAIHSYDSHPPAFYFFLYYWTKLGNSTLFLRIPGIILGSLSIVGVYLLGKELINKETGLIVAFMTAVSVSHVYMCREIRMYVYLSFFVIFGFYFFVKLFDKGQESRVKSQASPSTALPLYRFTAYLYWILYTICMVASWYLHYFGIIVAISQNIIVLLFWKRINIKYWIFSQAAIVTCYLPWFSYFFIHVFERGLAGEILYYTWYNKIMLLLLKSFTSTYIIYPKSPLFSFFVLAAILISMFFSIVAYCQKNRFFLAVIFIGFFTQLVFCLFNFFQKTEGIFSYRYFFYILPFYFFIVAGAFMAENKSKKYLMGFIILLFLIFNLNGLHNMYYVKEYTAQRWREAANNVRQYYKEKDCIIVQGRYQSFAFNYCFKRKHKEYYLFGNELEKLKNISQKHQRIWLVMSYVWQDDPKCKVYNWLLKNRKLKLSAKYGNVIQPEYDVYLMLFERK